MLLLLRLRPVVLALLGLALLAAPARADHVAEVRLTQCAPDAGTAAFEGRMGAGRGGARMQMRFTLQVATQERPAWTRVPGPGLDQWLSGAPGADRYVHLRRVRGLLGPARYRMVVRFRWLDAAGRPTARARRASPACRQDEVPMLLQ
jgi:hypothetical protein